MRARLFDHIDFRVKNMDAARKFYARFLPQLGFVRQKHETAPEGMVGDDFLTFYSAGGDMPSEFFGIVEDKNHQPNGTRIAFWADDKNHQPNGTRIAFWAETHEQVDRIAELVREAGG